MSSMNWETLTTWRRKVDQYFFRIIKLVVRLIERESDRRNSAVSGNSQRRDGCKCVAWAQAVSSPERSKASGHACALQDQTFVISYLMTLIMVPDHKNILDRYRIRLWICDGHRHGITG